MPSSFSVISVLCGEDFQGLTSAAEAAFSGSLFGSAEAGPFQNRLAPFKAKNAIPPEGTEKHRGSQKDVPSGFSVISVSSVVKIFMPGPFNLTSGPVPWVAFLPPARWLRFPGDEVALRLLSRFR